MAFLNIPKGKSEFEKIRREGLYYVDKTGLIGEILKSSGTQVTLITRPRRFGKTLGMSTLECFLDIQKDSKSLFEGLEAPDSSMRPCRRAAASTAQAEFDFPCTSSSSSLFIDRNNVQLFIFHVYCNIM